MFGWNLPVAVEFPVGDAIESVSADVSGPAALFEAAAESADDCRNPDEFLTVGLNFPVEPLGSVFVFAVGWSFRPEEWIGCRIQDERLVVKWRESLRDDYCFVPVLGSSADGSLAAIPKIGKTKNVRKNFLDHASPSSLLAITLLWGQARIEGQSK